VGLLVKTKEKVMDTDTVGMETTLVEVEFSTADRCDRCGAQAHVQVFLPSGLDLLFCNHHGTEHAKKLEQVALTIRSDKDNG
jgi:hypothetical protein